MQDQHFQMLASGMMIDSGTTVDSCTFTPSFPLPLHIQVVTFSGETCCTLLIESLATRVTEMKEMIEQKTGILRDEQDIILQTRTTALDDRCRLHHYADALFGCSRMHLVRKLPKPADPCVLGRLKKELAQISCVLGQTSDVSSLGFLVGPIDGDLNAKPLDWIASICGPVGTAYEGGVFNLTISIPRDYPFQPPRVRFVTNIFHPLVTSTGFIDLDVLHDRWSPALTLVEMVRHIRSLLENPYYAGGIEHAECLCGNAVAARLSQNPEAFNQHVREWTRAYATSSDC